VHPVIFELGRIKIFSFGLMLVIAFLVGGFLITRMLRSRGHVPDHLEGYPMVGLLGGIVGAKLYYIFAHLGQLGENPWSSLLSGSGLTWYGGLMGGAAAVLIWARRHRQDLWSIADCCAPGLAIGYAIGRIGCQLAGDGDYGPPSDLPWAMAYPKGVVPTLEACHPTPVYETLMMAGVALVLWKLRDRPVATGWLVGVYLMLAGAERWIAEIFRVRPEKTMGMSVAQWMSIGVIAVGLIIVAARRRRNA
jgi:phosphatidylglycerol:prolipoprotein diacylglycerol transferase